jgi:integrase
MLQAALELEAEHRGLTWEKVRYIRSSEKPNVALASELGVSDVLISKVRRRLLWDGEPGPRRRNDIPRHALIATLLLAGPRILQLCLLDGEDMDFAGGRIRVPRIKTEDHHDTDDIIVPMVPSLRETLLLHRAEYDYGPASPVFATRNGTRNTQDNVRRHVVDPVRDRANELLAKAGRPAIARLTPHTLRRTFASILAECGVPPRRAMYLLGHTNPKLTMAVYQQVLDMGGQAVESLETILGCTLDDACQMYSGRQPAPEVLAPNWHPATRKPSGGDPGESVEGSKGAD